MRRNLCGGILALALLAGAAGTSAAQETGTPIFKAPYRAFTSHEFGVSLSDPGEGVSLALEGFYRYGSGANDFSLRGGFADLNGSGRHPRPASAATSAPRSSATARASRSTARSPSASAPTSATARDAYYIPVGISLGRRFELEGSNTIFVPYAHPVIVPTFGGGDSDVNFALGLGVDIRFSEQWAIRASGGLGDIEGVGVSVAYIR